jgi:organic hydroperoxide reductase OsmC/OhrA
MTGFPKVFEVSAHGGAGINSRWTNQLVDKDCLAISLAIPPEFEGPGGTYSPEDLFALSLLNCYLATFKFVAEKSKLIYAEISGKATLYVDKGEEKSPWMQRVLLHFELIGAENSQRAVAIMEKTKNNCMIINSVKTKVDFSFELR